MAYFSLAVVILRERERKSEREREEGVGEEGCTREMEQRRKKSVRE